MTQMHALPDSRDTSARPSVHLVSGDLFGVPVAIESYGRRGTRPIYAAKVGTGPSTSVVVKRARKFSVGQRIDFAETWDERGKSVGCTPKWRPGRIWKIEDNRLFIANA